MVVRCSEGASVTGGGASVQSVERRAVAVLTASRPDPVDEPTGWYAEAADLAGQGAATWRLTAYAICSAPPGDDDQPR